MKKNLCIWVLVISASLALGLFSWADADSAGEEGQEERHHTVTFSTRTMPSSDIESQDGDIDIVETAFGWEYEFKAFDKMPVELSIDAGVINLDNDGISVELPAHLKSRSLGLGVKLPAPFLDEEHFFTGWEIYPTMNTEGDTFDGGAFRMPMRAYLIYRRDENFILIGGVTVRPDYDTTVLPVLGLIYKPNDRLSFNLASDDPHIAYELTDKARLRWDFDYTFEEYEVNRGDSEDVVLKFQDASTGIGIECDYMEYVKAGISVGYVFNRRLEYEDGEGKVLPEGDVYVRAQIMANF